MKSKFKYLPSFSVGAFGDGLRRNVILKSKSGKEDLPIRFYSQDFPEKFRHNDFLVSAGHLLKHDPDCWNTMGFDNNNFVMGDSGGYQICSGAMKWKDGITPKVFDWLQKNATVGMNLDIPPRLKYDGKFYDCLDLSSKNFRYFADKQDGQTDYMNVIQGKDEYEFKTWYDEVKQYPFQGWAIGGSGFSYYKFLSGLMILLEGKEHLNPNTKYIHILGTSRVTYFLLLLQLQKSFEEMGLDIVVTTDSSSPDRAVVFGTYYTGFSLKRGTWESINFPNEKNHEEIVDDFLDLHNPKFPYVTEFDKMLTDYVDFTDIRQTTGTEGIYTYGMRLHNFEFFKDVLDRVETLVYGHNYLLEQSISKDINQLMKFVDEMVKSDKPRLVFEKYKDLITKMSNTNNSDNVNPDAKKFFGV